MNYFYVKYPIFNNIYFKNLNFIKYIYTLYSKNLIIYNYLYIKYKLNKNFLSSLISENIIIKELTLLSKINLKNISKNKHLLSFSNKKISNQKGLGKARNRNKKSPIFLKGIKLFKNNKKNRLIKINKKKWILILNYILYNKKSFIVFYKYNLLKNFKFNIFNLNNNFLLISNISAYTKKNIININNINLLFILKYKYIIIII